MLEKQKRVIQSLEEVIAEQKIKITRMCDVPEDVLELKELIGNNYVVLIFLKLHIFISKYFKAY